MLLNKMIKTLKSSTKLLTLIHVYLHFIFIILLSNFIANKMLSMALYIQIIDLLYMQMFKMSRYNIKASYYFSWDFFLMLKT